MHYMTMDMAMDIATIIHQLQEEEVQVMRSLMEEKKRIHITIMKTWTVSFSVFLLNLSIKSLHKWKMMEYKNLFLRFSSSSICACCKRFCAIMRSFPCSSCYILQTRMEYCRSRVHVYIFNFSSFYNYQHNERCHSGKFTLENWIKSSFFIKNDKNDIVVLATSLWHMMLM